MPMPETVWKMDPHVPQLDRGYVHVYTGDGKGKTTAALGSALRAAGSGLQVAVAAFMRNGDCGEFEMLEQLEAGIQVYYYGSGCFIHGKPARLETIRAHRGCRSIYHLMNSRQFDLLILDEVNLAVACRLLRVEALLEIIRPNRLNWKWLLPGDTPTPRLLPPPIWLRK